MPLPDDGDDSIEATRLRALILTAANSTINQTIDLRSAALSTASDARDIEMEQFIEERRQQALVGRRAPRRFSAAGIRRTQGPLIRDRIPWHLV